jgi:N-hydroxyarylamine O-acetyltransferase
MPDFDTAAYLARVGLAEPPPPTAEGLATLHRAQAYAIPFENFDILLDRGISLDPEAVFDKLVRRRRGGYCFELNGLFLEALGAFGFDARALLGRVHIMGPPTGRSHQISLVRIGTESWIADVGFGGTTAPLPMPLRTGTSTDVGGSLRRYVEDERFGYMLQAQTPEGWADYYSFDLGHVGEADREMGNHFTATHPASFFTWARVASRPTPEGRVSLMDFTLRTVTDGEERLETVPPGDAYLDILRSRFGVDLAAPYEALRPVREDSPVSL